MTPSSAGPLGGRTERIESGSFTLRPSRLWRRAPRLLAELREQGARRVSVAELLDGADRRARALGPAEPALAALRVPVVSGFGWDRADAADHRWYPQGISSSHDADPSGTWDGREVLVVSWALDNHAAVRVSFAEIAGGEVRRYRHVSLGEPTRAPWERRVRLRPVRVHAGGIAWAGRHLWVADTLRGLRAFGLDEIVELPGGELLLPQVGAHRLPLLAAVTARGPRFSYLSLERPAGGGPATLASGEYRDKRPGARIVRWPLPAGGGEASAELHAEAAFASPATNMQAALGLDGRLVLVSSAGRGPGRLAVHEHDGQRTLVHPWATGPEDLTHLRGRGTVMSLTERPHDPVECARCGRVVFGVETGALLGN